jgi:hypothetical protein
MAKKTRKARKPPPPVDDGDDEEDEFADIPQVASKKKTKKSAKKKRPKRAPRSVPESSRTVTKGEVSDKPAPRPMRRVANLDDRKLTKKQKSQLEDWRGENHGKRVDLLMQGVMENARKKFNHSAVLAATDTDNLIIVIPSPSLAFEYLIVQDGFPLGLVMHLNGPPGSLKSALLFEFMNWFRMAGGGAVYEEVETKFSPDLPRSIMGYGKDEVGMILNRCEAVEDWQDHLTFNIKQLKKDMVGTKEKPGPGRTVPIILGVDSIMGKSSWETQEKIAKEGHGGRGFPIEALGITQYMKAVPQTIDGWPFALVLNNHLKIGKDEDGREVKRTAGGQGVNFQESWELQTQVCRQKLQSASWDGVQVRIKCAKNSFGATWRQIETRMLWWEEQNKDTGDYEQVTIWDWDWAAIKMLSTLKGRPAANLKDIGFHLATPKTSDVENTAWSRNLGMKAEDAVSWQEVGKMIREDRDLTDKIRTALSIKRRPYLQGDYLRQLEEMTEDLP